DENRNPIGVQVNEAVHVPVCLDVLPFCSDPDILFNEDHRVIGIQVTTQAADNGLFSIDVTELTNATLDPQPAPPIAFPLGTQEPVMVTALKDDLSTCARLALDITAVC